MRRANQLVGLTPTFYILNAGRENRNWKVSRGTGHQKKRQDLTQRSLRPRAQSPQRGWGRVRHRTLAMSGCVEGAEWLWHIAYRGPERRTPWSSHSFSYLG